jgi:O-antigen/teichoic acid export membrane protein
MLQNIATVFVGDLISKILLAAAALLLIRVLSPTEYAQYTIATAAFSVVIQAAGAGFSRVYLVSGGVGLGVGQAKTFLVAQLIAGVAIALIAGLALTLPLSILVGVLWLSVAGCCVDFLKTLYQSRLRFGFLSAVELVRSMAFLMVVGVAVLAMRTTHVQAWLIVMLQAASFSVASIPLLSAIRENAGNARSPSVQGLFKLVSSRPLSYLVGYFLMLSILSSADIYMLRKLSDDLNLATYGSAFRYYSLILVALYSLNTVMLPVLQRAATATAVNAVFHRQRRIIMIAIPAILIMALTTNLWIPVIDGGKYVGASAVFRILSVSAAISIVCSPWVNMFLIAGRYSELLVLVIVAVATSIVVSAVLVPKMGAEGAAIATLCASGALNVGIALRFRTNPHRDVA